MPDTERLKVLIAGCGTGKQAIDLANHVSDVEITACDIATRSLSYGIRQARTWQADIRFVHRNILDIESLGEQFDLIECTGVLHHMQDVSEGLGHLLTALKPDGLLFLALYSRHARKDILELREVCRHIEPSNKNLRELRYLLIHDEGYRHTADWRDFYNLSEFRDLVMNRHEINLTIPDIRALLDEHDLEFLGFVFPNPAVARHFDLRYPEPGSRLQLDYWDEFEQAQPNIFSGMYQFHCRRKPAA